MEWSTVFSLAFLVQVLAASLNLATPLVYAALGEIFVERSGVLNLGIEGIMLLSGLSGFYVAVQAGSLWLGILAGIVTGGLLGLFFAFLTVTLRSDQIVTGLAFLILSSGLALFLYRILFGGQSVFPHIEPMGPLALPVLGELPLLGPILFNQTILTHLMLVLVVVSAGVLWLTPFGLRVNAVGEYPAAADALGINVPLVRYICLVVGGAFMGLAGAYFPLAELGFYSNSMIGGRGFIALALVVFGRWNPVLALAGGLVFGAADALQIRLQLVDSAIPSQLMIALPYLLTILVILAGRSRKAPSALTVPYTRE
jgi:simple sugar transport system permease protein